MPDNPTGMQRCNAAVAARSPARAGDPGRIHPPPGGLGAGFGGPRESADKAKAAPPPHYPKPSRFKIHRVNAAVGPSRAASPASRGGGVARRRFAMSGARTP